MCRLCSRQDAKKAQSYKKARSHECIPPLHTHSPSCLASAPQQSNRPKTVCGKPLDTNQVPLAAGHGATHCSRESRQTMLRPIRKVYRVLSSNKRDGMVGR